MPALFGTLIVACCSAPSQPCYDFNESCFSLKPCSISWRSGVCQPHILASSCIAPSLLGSSTLLLFAS